MRWCIIMPLIISVLPNVCFVFFFPFSRTAPCHYWVCIKSVIIHCNARQRKPYFGIISQPGTALGIHMFIAVISLLQVLCIMHLRRTQTAINQNENEMDHNGAEWVSAADKTNLTFIFYGQMLKFFSSTRYYAFANLQEQAPSPFVSIHSVFIFFPLFLYRSESLCRASETKSCLIINCWSAMTCLLHFHSVLL